jgi:hypothetical protein
MAVIDCIYADEISGDALHTFALRAHALLQKSNLIYPVSCTLFGSASERLVSWELSGADDDGPTSYAQDSVEERWMRSANGVSLLLTDAAGEVAEMVLVIGQPQ